MSDDRPPHEWWLWEAPMAVVVAWTVARILMVVAVVAIVVVFLVL